jgi:biopolymer transport protein TolR
MSINKQDVSLRDLPTRLRTIFEDRRNKTMFIVGDANLRYADIVYVIDSARGAGVAKVGVVTEGMRRGATGG